jgi:hypothetical protein
MRKIIGSVIIVLLGVVVLGAYFLYPSERKPIISADIRQPVFEKIILPFQTNWSSTDSHSLTASAAIDINNDGADEIFIGGSQGQTDALLSWQDGKIIDVTTQANLGDLEATYGANSIDIDANGFVDLLTVGNNGLIIWLNDNGKFTANPYDVIFPENSVAMDIAASDFDRDGDVDLYLSMFINPANFRSPVFNDPDHARTNILLRNDGDLKFTDVTDTASAGLQNTFVSSFADLNSDGIDDLVLAQNTGQIEILKGLGDGKFESQNFTSGYGFWMGLALADYDADGDVDLFFSNIGNSIPSAVLTGDIRDDQPIAPEWILLRNDGDFKFTDVTDPSKLTGFGFAWGASFSDFNLDGVLDLAVAQNYIKWPIHELVKLPSKLLLGDGSNSFVQSDAIKSDAFSVNPLILDVDGNGKPDLVWVNINDKSVLQLNKTNANFIALRLPDNQRSSGAIIRFDREGLPALVHIAGQGLGSDMTTTHTIGIDETVEGSITATIYWSDGTTTQLDDLQLNAVNMVDPYS